MSPAYKHGFSQKSGRIYPLWKSIKYRCNTPSCKSYKDYGERGIKVCPEWDNDFMAFYEWAIANGYKEEKTDKGRNILTIDRIDVNGDYEPSNCRFVTNLEQARNKRNTMKEEEKKRECVICGKPFQIDRRGSHKETCSKECFKKWCSVFRTSNKDYTKICPECGKPYEAKRGGHYKIAKYCSKRCRDLSISPVWEYNGKSMHVTEWAKEIGINAHCLLHRKELGWDIERILTTPMRGKKNAC